jgi:ATP-dependent DNA helicase RecQ
MSSPNDALSKFRVDWQSLDRRRNADLSKLEAVQKYAYTKLCRRGFVLRYFGDPAARSKCEGCDNCLGITVSREPAKSAGEKLQKPRRNEKKSATRQRVVTSSVSDNDEVVLGAQEQRLLAALKTKRLEIARQDSVPAYIVFSDRTLADIALRRPVSLEALANVRGVGEMKLERYGEKFLAVIRGSDETEAA